MDGEISFDLFKQIFEEIQKLLEEGSVLKKDIKYVRLLKLLHLLVPMITAIVVYYYLKYLLIFNAFRYENSVKDRNGYVRRVSRQLKSLAKRYGNFYFCYMPMTHGTVMPRPYTLFIAIKEVLINSNRPATRNMRTNLLMDLLHSDHHLSSENASEARKRDYLSMSCNELESLSDFNLSLMKCSRELIIQGVKDFDVMSTVYRIMETVLEDAE